MIQLNIDLPKSKWDGYPEEVEATGEYRAALRGEFFLGYGPANEWGVGTCERAATPHEVIIVRHVSPPAPAESQ